VSGWQLAAMIEEVRARPPGYWLAWHRHLTSSFRGIKGLMRQHKAEQTGHRMTNDDARRAKIDAWIDGWMEKLNARAKTYQAQGVPPDVAVDRATFDIRMEIRRSPALELE
jgi:hypothetical protein